MTQRATRVLALVAVLLLGIMLVGSVTADHLPDPASVTIAGSFQSELGCTQQIGNSGGDWEPPCAITHLAYDAVDDVWQGTFDVAAGAHEYKAALNDTWDVAFPGGNLTLTGGSPVKFYYDHKTHFVSDSTRLIIAAVGDWQSELGCPGDWAPDCLRGWMTDPDNDGTYTFETEGIPPGNWEGKGATGESWDNPNFPVDNIGFIVPAAGGRVLFSFVDATDTMSIEVFPFGNGSDDIEYYGLGHNSHDTLYRAPFGAVTPGTEVFLRFRTYHDDVESVRARVWDETAQGQFFLDFARVAADVSCYDEAQPDETCDFWQASYTPDEPTTLYYRFIVADGTATAYYADDNFRDGGWGEALPDMQDRGYVIQVYDADFVPISWLQNGVMYQIFPDRFRNGRSNNDPTGNEPRYGWPTEALDRIILKSWSDLPEGYCRFYVNPAEACTEGPRGRDYFGGDLMGVQQRLNYLKSLGVTIIYFNPIFDAASNHAYDTQDYYTIDPFFGTNVEFGKFVKAAQKAGMKVVLDGVFNHVSSDSKYFDRYGHFAEVGACESVNSPYRDWFTFRDEAGGPCAGPNGPNTMNYDAWFGFDSLPVLNKDNQEVRDLFYATENSVGRYWLDKGAAGWRLDVMSDGSFPAEFWQGFRDAVKAEKSDAAIIAEAWKKFEILPKTRGDQADTAMGYRFRNAILGFFGTVDDKGFEDDGATDQPPSFFATKLISIREDNPDASYYTMMNILGSHDTQRILWLLTPGERNREDREFNAANVAAGTQLLKLATVVQMTTPGMPTIYYGDEVGLTGDDDPDDRRPFPWTGGGPFGVGGDQELREHYDDMIGLRRTHSVFRQGEMTFLLTDDANRTLAYLMRAKNQLAIVAINRNDTPQQLVIDARGMVPDAVKLIDRLGTVPGTITAANGTVTIELPALSAAILMPKGKQDITPPNATTLSAEAGSGQIALSWNPVKDGTRFRIYRSIFTGGGYEFLTEVAGTSYVDATVENGMPYYYVVTALDAKGNEGEFSNEASATPSFAIDWANLQWPPTMNHTISAVNRTEIAYGQVWINGVTNQPGRTPTLMAQLGYGPDGSNPAGNPAWLWEEAEFNTDAGNNDEFMARLLPEAVGEYDYLYRYSTNGGATWLYADQNGPIPTGAMPPNPGALTVTSSGDTTAPTSPANLTVLAQSPDGIELSWDAVVDPTLYGYEVFRGDTAGGPYVEIGETSETTFIDENVAEDATYYYVVRAVDTSFNRSGFSNEVAGMAERRTVTVTFNVTVPATTDATGRAVTIAGTLDRLDGGYTQWTPGETPLTRVDATHWTVSLTGLEGTQIEYKYVLDPQGNSDQWFYVEKNNACGEVDNRPLTLNYGSTGIQTVNDTVVNWRNIAPCGN